MALRAAGLRLNDEWATAENLYSRAFDGHLSQARRSHHHALSLDVSRFEMDMLERDRQLARRLEHISGELRDSVDAIFDALEGEMEVDQLGDLMHNVSWGLGSNGGWRVGGELYQATATGSSSS